MLAPRASSFGSRSSSSSDVPEAVPPPRGDSQPRYIPDPSLLVWSPHRLLMAETQPESVSEVRRRYSPKHTWSPPWLSPDKDTEVEQQQTRTAGHSSPQRLGFQTQSPPSSAGRVPAATEPRSSPSPAIPRAEGAGKGLQTPQLQQVGRSAKPGALESETQVQANTKTERASYSVVLSAAPRMVILPVPEPEPELELTEQKPEERAVPAPLPGGSPEQSLASQQANPPVSQNAESSTNPEPVLSAALDATPPPIPNAAPPAVPDAAPAPPVPDSAPPRVPDSGPGASSVSQFDEQERQDGSLLAIVRQEQRALVTNIKAASEAHDE
jgi:hypothetical protein